MINRLKFLLLIAFIVSLPACHVARFAGRNFANITDHRIFPSRPLPKSEKPFTFFDAAQPKKIGKFTTQTIDSICMADHTVAFMVIRADTMLVEHYYNKYDTSSLVASFSMAKSYTSALIGAAIADGFIKSVEDPITNYITELGTKPGFEKIKIKHLLQMNSGILSNESYINPFGQAAKIYYGRSLRKYIAQLEVDYEPGTRFAYRSINTQLLGLILERATGKPVTEFMYEKIWQHLGTEFDASWSLDRKNGLEKTFCCINARARDFAKFGRLYLNKGNWNGTQVLPQSWIEESTVPQNSRVSFYNYQWWFSRTGFYAQGILGQFIFVNPQKNLIIVRLGKHSKHTDWPGLFDAISNSL